MFNPSEQTTITVITYQINSIWYISTYPLMAYEPNKGSVFSHLSSVLPCVISTMNGAYRFRRAVFPCKGREARSHTKNHRLFRNKFCAEPSADCTQSGYSTKFIPEFLGEGYLLASLLKKQGKRLKAICSR